MTAMLRKVFGGLVRIVATVAIFSVAGPLAFAALIFLIVFGFGAPVLELLRDLASLGNLSPLASVAIWVLAIGAMLSAVPPSVIAGVVFSLAAVCAGFSAAWVAWCATAVAIAGIILIGASYVPDESSAVLLPNIRGAEPVVRAFVGLNVLAFLPTTFCWWLARPLHRAGIAA
jgi:hypothetical protein